MTENKEDINERINAVIQHLNIRPAEFSSEIGINNNATISRIAAGKVKPSYEILKKIFLRYPQINSNWLLTGEGSMLKGNQNSNNYTPEMKENEQLLAQLRDEVNEQRENVKYFKEMCRKMQEEIERLTLLITGNPENKKKEAI